MLRDAGLEKRFLSFFIRMGHALHHAGKVYVSLNQRQKNPKQASSDEF
jgi:hypothetical protein